MAEWSLRRTERAKQDLFDIWAYIAVDDEVAAERTVEAIWSTFVRTANFPKMGSSLSWLPADHRSLVSGAYLIIYQILDVERELLLVRVLHGARNLPVAFDME